MSEKETQSKFDPRGPLRKTGPKRKPLSHLLRKYTVTARGCWEWTATKNLAGYGVVGICIEGKPVGVPAPRLQWMHSYGPIPAGMTVMHVCDNRACINPDHLVLGTQRANLADMRAKGRHNHSGLKNFSPERDLSWS